MTSHMALSSISTVLFTIFGESLFDPEQGISILIVRPPSAVNATFPVNQHLGGGENPVHWLILKVWKGGGSYLV